MLECWMSFFLYSLPVSEPMDIEVEKCNENELYIRENDSLFSADFFNVTFVSKESRMQACELLMKSDHVQIEIDPLIHQEEPLLVYLFVDSNLFQSRLIEQKLAVISLEFQDYKYTKAMQEAEVVEVMGDATPNDSYQKSFDFRYLIIIALFIVVIWQIINHI